MGSFTVMIGSMVGLGILIGLAVLYTSALISFEELKRELSWHSYDSVDEPYAGSFHVGEDVQHSGFCRCSICTGSDCTHGRCCIYQFTIDSEKTKSGSTGIASDGEGVER